MNDLEDWIYFDGPEPESMRPLLDALRDRGAAAPLDEEALSRRFFATLDAMLASREAAAGEAGQGSDAAGVEDVEAAATPRMVEEGEGVTPRLRVIEEPREAEETYGPPITPVPVMEVSGAAVESAAVSAPQGLTGTAPALDLSPEEREKLGLLPFRAAVPGQPQPPPAPPPGAAKTMEVPVMGSEKGKTAPLGDDSISKIVAAIPYAREAGDAVVHFPELTVRGYASLRVELVMRPDQTAATLQRYRVPNEAARRALDEHWWKRLSERPEFDVATDFYADYVRTHWR